MRVLMLTPWPIARFLHGGQLRAAAIFAAYKARGHDVVCVGQYDPALTSDVGPDDYAVPTDIVNHVTAHESHSELAFWGALSRMPQSLEAYSALIARMRPDVLQFEEPYLWPLVRALRDLGRLDGVRIIHSSYNHETEAKREIRASGTRVAARTIADVAGMERDIAAEADAVIVVSDGDAAAFRAMGARRVVVATNGSAPAPDDPEADAALDAYLQGAPFALFVSSAHPPNARGLVDLAEASSARLTQGLLLVCGGVSSLLRDMKPFAEFSHIFARARLLGVVSSPLLGAMYRRACVVVLPKTRGGGSNLKTAEALLSGRPVVATPRAFAGFEQHASLPGVLIEDDPALFWDRVAHALAHPAADGSMRAASTMTGLLWPQCLAPMIDLAEALVAKRDSIRS